MISSRKRPQSSFDASSCGHRRHTLMCHMCQAPGKHKLSHQGPTTRSSSRFVLLRWVPGMLVRPDRDRTGARCSSGRRHHRQPAGARGEMPALQERQHRGIILSRVLSPTPRPEEPLAVVRWSPVGPTIRHGRCHAGGVMLVRTGRARGPERDGLTAIQRLRWHAPLMATSSPCGPRLGMRHAQVPLA
jgi:hypothetical protein